jgi:hypothetical protein
MPYPIVNVKTRDGLILHGLLTEPVKPAKTIDIHIHGAGGNFYGNSYFEGFKYPTFKKRQSAQSATDASNAFKWNGAVLTPAKYVFIFSTKILI